MIKYTEMSTEIIEIQKIILKSNFDDITIWVDDESNICFTNNDSEEFDASTFYFAIPKEDWVDIKKFIEKQLAI